MKGSKLNKSPQGKGRRILGPRSVSGYDSRIHGQPEPAESRPPAGRSTAPEITPDQWAIDTVRDRLDGWRPCGDGFAARCPAHADWNPSLSVGETEEGHVLLNCHAGCSLEEILDAMGLKPAHLFTSEYARRFGLRRNCSAALPCPARTRAGVSEINHEKFGRIIADARADDDEVFMPLCRATGLSVRACREFGLGVKGPRFVVPEWDDQLRPVGVVYRGRDGAKRCHPGSTRGLAVPVTTRRSGGKLYVTEGATDAMALHSLRVRAIGRPAATGPYRDSHRSADARKRASRDALPH